MTDQPNPLRVEVARTLLGLKQDEVAERSRISQSNISQIENGIRPLSVETAHKLADGLDLPPQFFYISEAGMKPTELNFRKLGGASIRATNQLATIYGEARRVGIDLMESTGRPLTNIPYADGVLGSDEIEEVAADLRLRMGFAPDEPVRHLMRSAERLGVGFAPLTPVNNDWQGHDGVSGQRNEHVIIGYIPSPAGDRARLSVGHELGHVCLHTNRPNLDQKHCELEAMRFAGALLLPRETAERNISESLSINGYVRLKAQFGISIAATIRRGYDLDLISQRRYKSLYVQISTKGWRKSEPVEVGIEQPALLWKLMAKRWPVETYKNAAPEVAMAERLLRVWVPERSQPRRPPGRASTKLATVTSLYGRAS